MSSNPHDRDCIRHRHARLVQPFDGADRHVIVAGHQGAGTGPCASRVGDGGRAAGGCPSAGRDQLRSCTGMPLPDRAASR